MNKLSFWSKTAEHASLSVLLGMKQLFQMHQKNHIKTWQNLESSQLSQRSYALQPITLQLDIGAI